ncbi:MAG: polysaccharide biosynthesis protein [Candidatus Atribacteria bacterium]|nr:polysaccharide biosynthesis protein [Candidatus Atribacteria bacterium]
MFKNYDSALSRILRRSRSIFTEDIHNNQQSLKENISKSRLLIIGAAGSIGNAFVKQVAKYSPMILHLIDLSENNLVEVVRDLRSSQIKLPKDFKTYAIAMGSVEFNAFLESEFNYDYILNFAAMKHVRSEKDPYSLMRILNTNVYYVKELLEELTNHDVKKFFSVSSDKAVNPVSLMGATKAFMENIMWAYSDKVNSSTARFANVAFSDGSLLYGFQQRLAKNQPLSAPSDVQRYFISHEEAGQLCLLSCFLGNNRDIYFPQIGQDLELITFAEIARIFLKSLGYEPTEYPSEQAAREAAESMENNSKQWPCFFSESDTTGEKPYEEFYTENDEVDFETYQKIGIIHQTKLNPDQKAILLKVIQSIEDIQKSKHWGKKEIVELIKIAVPELEHEEMGKNLDQKM